MHKFPFLIVLLLILILSIGGCAGDLARSTTPQETIPATRTPESSPTISITSSSQPLPEPTAPQVVTPIAPTSVPEDSATKSPNLFNSPVVFFLDRDGYLSRTDLAGKFVERLALVSDKISEDTWLTSLFHPSRVSPNGQWLVLNDDQGRWSLFNLAQGQETAKGRGVLPTWSPDNQHFAYLDRDGQLIRDRQLCLYDLKDQTNECSFWEGEHKLITAVWSPDGRYIAVADTNPDATNTNSKNPLFGTGQVWLVDTSNAQAELVGTYSATLEPAVEDILEWLPDSSGILIKTTGDVPSTLYSLAESSLIQFSESVISISPKGQYILYGSAQVGRLDDTILYSLPNMCANEQPMLLNQWKWSRNDDRLVYIGTCSNTPEPSYFISVVKVTTGDLLWHQSLPQQFQVVDWSPDGTFIFLDNDDPYPDFSPIWRLAADGSGQLETIVTQGLFLGIVPQWSNQANE